MWRIGAPQRLGRYADALMGALPQWKRLDVKLGIQAMSSIVHLRAKRAFGAAPQVRPRTDEDVRLALSQLPHYRVMLHNDDYNAMDYVVLALVRTVPRLSTEEAMRVMIEAHTNGIAQVIICPKETAEFYRAGLEQYGLTSTIEPA